MALIAGTILAIVVGLFATAFGLDRDRAFYPTVMIVVASYYALFAAMGGSTNTLVIECFACVVFLALAVAGFKLSLWLLVVALAAHGIFDLVHNKVIANPGVPVWWPQFCLAYDVTAAAYLAWLIKRRRLSAAI